MAPGRIISKNHYGGPRPRLDMTGDFRLWQQQVRRALQGLLGVRQGTPISLQHAMQALYGDIQFAAFVTSRAWEQAGLDGSVGQELLKLKQQLDAFEEPDSDDDLAVDPQWQYILAQIVAVTALLL